MGETTEVQAADGAAEAYLAGKPGDPGVLFYIDAIGLRPQIEDMADRIASWGYVVLAPNVFYRDGAAADLAPKKDLREPGAREERHGLVEREAHDEDPVLQHEVADDLGDGLAPRGQDDKAGEHGGQRCRHEQRADVFGRER